MCPSRPSDNDPEAPLPPGADRFWGQMSNARAGRAKEEPEPELESESADAPAGGHGHECLEWCPICRSVELLGTATSPEVRQQFQAIQTEAIQVLKAFAAAYNERTQGTPAGSNPGPANAPPRPDPAEPEVKDISID